MISTRPLRSFFLFLSPRDPVGFWTPTAGRILLVYREELTDASGEKKVSTVLLPKQIFFPSPLAASQRRTITVVHHLSSVTVLSPP